jgi:hypothetical protein
MSSNAKQSSSYTKRATNQKPSNATRVITPICTYCKNLNNPSVPFDHWLRESPDPKSPITCRVLRYTECSWCDSFGHTKKYCPDFISFLKRKKEGEEEFERYKKEHDAFQKEREAFQAKLEEEPQKTSAVRTPDSVTHGSSVGIRGFARKDESSPDNQNVSSVIKKDIVPKNTERILQQKETPSKINDAEFPCLSNIPTKPNHTVTSVSFWQTFSKK